MGGREQEDGKQREMGKLSKDENNNYYFGIICKKPAGLHALTLLDPSLMHIH